MEAAAYQVICVDLDHTLLRTDLTQEAILALIRRKPGLAWRLPLWMLKGRPYLKEQLVKHVALDVTALPYNEELIRRLQAVRHEKKIVLATASPEVWARKIADHLGLFHEVVATSDTVNLKGRYKADCLEQRYGAEGFCYVGDAWVDISVWRKARAAWIISGVSTLIHQARKVTTVEQVLPPPCAGVRSWLKALRIHQWIKNVLLFLPLLLAHKIQEAPRLENVVIGFLLFSLMTSSVYLINDLLDLEADRQHPRKRHRAFAAGLISIPVGLLAALALAGVALGVGYGRLGADFCLATLFYAIAVMAYSFHFKKLYTLDVILLGGFYTFRIYLGGIVADVPVSTWLAGFSMFFFLNLAFIKRFVEVKKLALRGGQSVDRRGYHVDDLSMIQSMGTSCGYLSVLIFTIYINGETVAQLYRHPNILWFISVFVLFWVTRLWFLAGRNQLDDDPIVFTLKDPNSYLIWFLIALLFWFAT
ncbi:MAG: hypothetical protein B9S32_03270 [Verrucomicrobia bacterium Tous-C9LFEB]|nr:MAG: hypothetical protein B9S32_03270 [Verrucomicrobia bacterium Tous-C9LFEB]